jgi:hypothetical protein
MPRLHNPEAGQLLQRPSRARQHASLLAVNRVKLLRRLQILGLLCHGWMELIVAALLRCREAQTPAVWDGRGTVQRALSAWRDGRDTQM